jgi:hypothetical protein
MCVEHGSQAPHRGFLGVALAFVVSAVYQLYRSAFMEIPRYDADQRAQCEGLEGLAQLLRTSVPANFGEALARTGVNDALPLRVRGTELLCVALFFPKETS